MNCYLWFINTLICRPLIFVYRWSMSSVNCVGHIDGTACHHFVLTTSRAIIFPTSVHFSFLMFTLSVCTTTSYITVHNTLHCLATDWYTFLVWIIISHWINSSSLLHSVFTVLLLIVFIGCNYLHIKLLNWFYEWNQYKSMISKL